MLIMIITEKIKKTKRNLDRDLGRAQNQKIDQNHQTHVKRGNHYNYKGHF